MPIVMHAVISSSPRKAGEAGVEHRRNDNQNTSKDPYPEEYWIHPALRWATPRNELGDSPRTSSPEQHDRESAVKVDERVRTPVLQRV